MKPGLKNPRFVGQAGLEPAPTSDLSSRMGAHSSHYATLPVVEACAGVEPASPKCYGVLTGWTNRLKILFSGFICRKPPVGDVILFGHCLFSFVVSY